MQNGLEFSRLMKTRLVDEGESAVNAKLAL